MCKKHPHRHPLQCIVPPYMMRKLLESNENNAIALKTYAQNLVLDEQIRSRRQVFGSIGDLEKKALAPESFSETPEPKPSREVYSAQNEQKLPGILLRREDESAPDDKDVNAVFDAAGYTFDFYYALFGRNSIDNQGMKIIQTVHYGQDYANAFWNGSQMVYGDGDGMVFNTFTADIDVIGHELTHGVIQFEANLVYQGQSGALNESLADVFGIMIKQRTLNEDVQTSDWLIGENILIGDKYAIRSMKEPGTAYVNHPELGTDPQPGHMDNYNDAPYDNGGVHLNSGIPNRAFYLAAYEAGGFAWEKVGQVWYKAMTNKTLVPENASFLQFKEATLQESVNLFGTGSQVTTAIENAWKEVGLDVVV